jgi:heme exporter protein CcmD
MLDFHAGKYAVFVWTGYGITAAVFALLIGDSLIRARRWRRAVQARERADAEAGERGTGR